MFTERQSEIIVTSIDIIAKHGIQSLTIKNISKEIGISEPAIYRHFESKTDILLAILKNFQELFNFVSAALDESNNSAIEKIDFLFSKIVEIFSKEPSQISVIFSEEVFKNEKVLREKIVEIIDTKSKLIDKIIADGQKAGSVRTDIDSEILSLMVMGSLRLMIKQWDLRNQHENLVSDGKKLIDGIKKVIEK